MRNYSFEKGCKFKDKDNFLDINYLFLPGYKWVLKKLYYTPIRPEAIALLSLFAGTISAYYYAQGEYFLSIFGAFFILIKNYLDSLDGHLARAKGLVSRFGRFLDSLGDAFVYIFLFTAIAINLSGTKSYLLAFTAMVCAFLQCSVYNYYVVSYKTFIYGSGANKTDERIGEDETWDKQENLAGKIVYLMQLLYQWIYGWQDRIVARIDHLTLNIYKKRVGETNGIFIDKSWYADKAFLAFISPLCFGTQILLLVICTITNNLEGYLIFMITGANLYTLSIIMLRTLFK